MKSENSRWCDPPIFSWGRERESRSRVSLEGKRVGKRKTRPGCCLPAGSPPPTPPSCRTAATVSAVQQNRRRRFCRQRVRRPSPRPALPSRNRGEGTRPDRRWPAEPPPPFRLPVGSPPPLLSSCSAAAPLPPFCSTASAVSTASVPNDRARDQFSSAGKGRRDAPRPLLTCRAAAAADPPSSRIAAAATAFSQGRRPIAAVLQRRHRRFRRPRAWRPLPATSASSRHRRSQLELRRSSHHLAALQRCLLTDRLLQRRRPWT